MAESISEALAALALVEARRLSEVLVEVAVEGLCREPHLLLFRALARRLVRQHTRALISGNSVYRDSLRRSLADPGGVPALLDALPDGPAGYEPQRLAAFERRFVAWRWRLRDRGDRLRLVHRALRLETVLALRDHDVGLPETPLEPGDPAVDLSAIAVGLLELGAREPLSWPEGYKPLFDAFWSTYLADSGDHELLDVAPPFLAWRALAATALPLAPAAQRKLFAFAEEVLAQRSFDPDEMSWMLR